MRASNGALGLTLFGVVTAAGAAAPGQPVQLDPITVDGRPPPVPELRLNPPYPMAARRRWEEGCVVLRFTVRPDGKTDAFAVLDSRPRGVFERAVIDAVFRWRYPKSAETRTVVETFEFRNSHVATQPRYTAVSVGSTLVSAYGGVGKYQMDFQLQGYSPPTCRAPRG